MDDWKRRWILEREVEVEAERYGFCDFRFESAERNGREGGHVIIVIVNWLLVDVEVQYWSLG